MAGTWTQCERLGKKIDIFEPSRKPRFGILFLHGLGLETLVDRPAFSNLFEERNLACLCPHGGRSWWADRICSEFDPHITPERYVLDTVMPYFKERWNLAPPALGVIGISMGGQGALRLAFKHPKIFPVAAGISSALDYYELHGQGTSLDEMYDSKEQCRQDTAIMHVPPYNAPPHIYFCIDPEDLDWHRGNDRLHEKLNALGVEHTMDLDTEAGGHSWNYFNHMAGPAVRFVYDSLDKLSRRLL